MDEPTPTSVTDPSEQDFNKTAKWRTSVKFAGGNTTFKPSYKSAVVEAVNRPKP